MRKQGAPERVRGVSRTDDVRIPFLAGRPKRTTAIGPDDLTNLVIAMHTCKTLEDFLDST